MHAAKKHYFTACFSYELLLMLLLVHRFLSPWWRRCWVPPKRRFLQEPHGVTSQKTPFFIGTTLAIAKQYKRYIFFSSFLACSWCSAHRWFAHELAACLNPLQKSQETQKLPQQRSRCTAPAAIILDEWSHDRSQPSSVVELKFPTRGASAPIGCVNSVFLWPKTN
jgi:hypothetical protein